MFSCSWLPWTWRRMRFLNVAAESLGNNPGLAIIRFGLVRFQFLSGRCGYRTFLASASPMWVLAE